MKSCPICNACCFDDMEVCYGCMHHFSLKQERAFKRDICEKREVEPAGQKQNTFEDSFLESENVFEGVLQEMVDGDSSNSARNEQSYLPEEVKRENRCRVPRRIASPLPNKLLVENSERVRSGTVFEKQAETRSNNAYPEEGFEERYELVVTVRPCARKNH